MLLINFSKHVSVNSPTLLPVKELSQIVEFLFKVFYEIKITTQTQDGTNRNFIH